MPMIFQQDGFKNCQISILYPHNRRISGRLSNNIGFWNLILGKTVISLGETIFKSITLL